MINVGDVLKNPPFGTEVEIKRLDTDGFEVEQIVYPGRRASRVPHFHKWSTEIFDILEGTATYEVNGESYTHEAGHTFTVPPRTLHIHPMNKSDSIMRFKQVSRFDRPVEGAAVDTFLVLSTFFGFSYDGLTTDIIPKNPLQAMSSLNLFRTTGVYTPDLPWWLQDIIMPTGALIARIFGKRPWYERFLPVNFQPDMNIDPPVSGASNNDNPI